MLDDTDEDDSPEDEAEQDTFTCPLCSWNTHSPGAIVRHVNTDHLDVISPSAHPAASASAAAVAPASALSSVSSSSRSASSAVHTDTENNILSVAKAGTSNPPQFVCPICNLDAKTGSSLEIHVNSEHAELLSPAKPLQPQVPDYPVFLSPRHGLAF